MALRPVIGALALSLLMVACSDDGEPVSEPTLSSNEDPSTSPSESSTPEGPEEIRTDFEADGLVVTDLPRVDGIERDAVETYFAYERGIRRLGRQAEMNSLVTDNAPPALVEPFRQTVEFLTSNDARFDGVVEIEVDEVQRRGGIVALDMCLDVGTLRLIRDGEPEVFEGAARSIYRVLLTQVGGQWQVTERTDREDPC